ncbi:hypothetical protein Tco_0976196 [Tanacetum coccineum]|uniref:Uncharacterized protein n=1 Tax=Tanacetum coccineum TaxID=301880 RepID=A0ABQ5EGK4_9ASTR
MNPIASQQDAIDNSLITAEVPEIYMHQFWNTIKKIGKIEAYEFKLDKKKCQVDTKVFHEILQIFPRLLGQDFVELPLEEDLLTFIKELGYSGKCIYGKSTGLDRLKESRAQVLWVMYNQKNVDYVALLWEDFMYQADNKEISSTRKEHMPYPRFTKVIIDHFISKDNSISMRNKINLHTAHDDNYKTYLDYASGKVPPKKARKFKKPASSKLKTVPTSPKEPTQKGKRVKRLAKKATTASSTGVVIRDTPDKSVSKKIAPAKTDRGKGIELLSDVKLLKDAQLKKTLRKIKRETHKLQASGSYENDDFNDKDDDGGNDDDNGSNDDGDYEEEEQDEEYVFTQEKDESGDEEKMYKEEDDDVAKELYGDLNLTQGLRDTDMTNAEQGGGDQHTTSHESEFVQEEDDGHVTLTTVNDKAEGTMHSSSVSSNFTSKLLNLDNVDPDVNEIASLMNTSIVPPLTPFTNPSLHLTTTPQQQTPDSTTATNPTITLPEIPNFTSLFRFKQRVSTLETKLSEFNQTRQFAEAVSSISGIVDQYLASKMKEVVDVTARLQLNKLKEEAKVEKQEFFNQVDSTMKAIIKEQVKAQVSKIMPHIEKRRIQDITLLHN